MLCIVGGGKMGAAILAGLLAKGTKGEDVVVVETNAATRESLKQRFPTLNVVEAPVAADGVVIAVKPKEALIAASDAVETGSKRVLSIAAGVTITQLHESTGHRTAVMRAMPNIGALVARSATALCWAPPAHDEDVAWAQAVLGALGVVVRVTEDQMDAVTGLSGSGPAYLFLVAEALIDAGVQAGLPLEVAQKLVISTLNGSAELLSGEQSPEALRHMVMTPAGTTAQGLRVLEERATRGAFIDAVLAATERSRETGRSTAQH